MAKPMPLELKINLAAQREAALITGTSLASLKFVEIGVKHPEMFDHLEPLMKSMTEANTWANHLAAVQALWDEATK